MSFEDEDESAPRTSGGAGNKGKKKKKTQKHGHIGPNARAFRSGLALCPSCDAEKILRPTEVELFNQRSAKEAQRASRSITKR